MKKLIDIIGLSRFLDNLYNEFVSDDTFSIAIQNEDSKISSLNFKVNSLNSNVNKLNSYVNKLNLNVDLLGHVLYNCIPDLKYFIIEATQDNTILKFFKTTSNERDISVDVSIDEGKTWNNITCSTEGSIMASLNTGEKIFIKSDVEQAYGSGDHQSKYFNSNKECYVYGNIMALLGSPESRSLNIPYVFSYFFYNQQWVLSKKDNPLHMDATKLSSSCYKNMFCGCTSLTIAPELPAEQLSNECYSSMFKNCTSLTTAPALPATDLDIGCYKNMFNGCTSLTIAPELPAEQLSNECYECMFYDCTSLTTAPELRASRLTYGCYEKMFTRCSSLNYIKCMADAEVNEANCFYWVSGVSQNGTFVKCDMAENWSIGHSGIPENWQIIDDA